MPILDLRGGKTQLVASLYRATKFLKEGRFAEVYSAHHMRDGIEVALKVYKEPMTSGKADDRALKECDVLKKLADLEFFPTRPSYSRDYFNHKRHHFIVMELGEYRWEEFEEGEGPAEDRKRWRKSIVPLAKVLPAVGSAAQPEQHRPEFWQPDDLAEWVGKLCEAVRLMHERKVLHLDLKPDNILLKRAAGESSVPFLLDFNTSAGAQGEPFRGGTTGYQAPEVKTGARKAPDRADDLYALALVIWEIHFGLGSHDNLNPGSKPHALVRYPVDDLRRVLLRALDREPSRRYPTAVELKQAVVACLRTPGGLSAQEMEVIRREAFGCRENIEEFLAGCHYLHVSKAKREEVASLFSNLSTETTDSQDLRDRLVQLGPKAIPAVFEEGYKLDPSSPQFCIVIDALAELGREEQKRLQQNIERAIKDRALGSIDQYCLSSTYVVRRMCRELCQRLEILPPGLRDSLRTDQMIYLPGERDELADLLIRLGQTPDDLHCLLGYLYGEYVDDPGAENYTELRDRVACRMKEMRVEGKAYLLADQAYSHAWENLETFRAQPEGGQGDLARGLLQLLGDAFASLEEEALDALNRGLVKPYCKRGRLAIWRSFATKLCQGYAPARAWLNALTSPPAGIPPRHVQELGERLRIEKGWSRGGTDAVEMEEARQRLRAVFADYLRTGQRSTLSRLVWSGRLDEVIALVSRELQAGVDPLKAQRVLDLLRNCGSKQRARVLDVAFEHYETFAAINYGQLLQVVCQNGLPAPWMRRKAEELLERDIERPERSSLAQEWLDNLLSRG